MYSTTLELIQPPCINEEWNVIILNRCPFLPLSHASCIKFIYIYIPWPVLRALYLYVLFTVNFPALKYEILEICIRDNGAHLLTDTSGIILKGEYNEQSCE